MRRMKQMIAGLAAVLVMAGSAEAANNNRNGLTKLQDEVRHELVMLPFYSMFDALGFQVNGSEVILSGYVTRPSLAKDAERSVQRIEGITKVTNNIEVLPLSPFDDRIRLSVARSVFGASSLYRYAMGANPSVRIIVKNGNVILEGFVSSEMDRNIANIQANSVPGVFSVTNNLKIDRS